MQTLLQLGASAARVEEAGDTVVSAACCVSVEPLSLHSDEKPPPAQALDATLPRVVCALEALAAVAAKGGATVPRVGRAGGNEARQPRWPLDCWLMGGGGNGFQMGVQSALCLLTQSSESPGVWPRLTLGAEAACPHRSGQPRPLLQCVSPYAHTPPLHSVSNILRHSLDGWAGQAKYGAEVLEHLDQGYHDVEYVATNALTWALRHTPIAQVAQHYGMTRAPLYPCESQTCRFEAGTSDEWRLHAETPERWRPQSGGSGIADDGPRLTAGDVMLQWSSRVSDSPLYRFCLSPGMALCTATQRVMTPPAAFCACCAAATPCGPPKCAA